MTAIVLRVPVGRAALYGLALRRGERGPVRVRDLRRHLEQVIADEIEFLTMAEDTNLEGLLEASIREATKR